MTTQSQDNSTYYANLLILQYIQEPRAYATVYETTLPALLPDSSVQFVKFSPTPASGLFTLNYGGVDTSSIQWNDSSGTIQSKLNYILTSPLSAIVSGSISSGLTVTFSNYTELEILSVTNNLLLDVHSNSVAFEVSQIGTQLPFDVQNAFNLFGDTAVGDQLDTIAKYVGVSRQGYGFNGPVTLNDAEFLLFIQMGIIRNRSGSSLATIQELLNQFFPNEIFVFDYQTMQMGYLISTSIGDQNLIDMFVTQGLLPRPMGVAISVIAVPVIDKFFAFRTYGRAAWVNTTPFQTYGAYNTSWLWLTYQDSIPAPTSS